MDTPTATPAAPAPPAAPTPITDVTEAKAPVQTAAQAAVATGNVKEFRAARRAERAGTPLPAAETKPAPAPAVETKDPAPAPTPKTIKLTQDELNERTRRAVQSALEEDRKQRTAAPAPAAPAPAPPTAEKFPTLEQWAATKANEGKTFTDYLDARDAFNADARAKAEQTDREFKTRAETVTKQTQAFANRMGEAITAEPDLAEKIPPAMRDPQGSIPLSGMNAEQLKTAKFSNLVAEAAFRSEKPGELLKYLHAHQDETVMVAELARTHGPVAALGALAVIDRRMGAPTPAAKPKPKTLTDAPKPQETLGTRPAETVDAKTAAIRSGNTRAYRDARRQERLAQMGR